jgi:hypothetical protein
VRILWIFIYLNFIFCTWMPKVMTLFVNVTKKIPPLHKKSIDPLVGNYIIISSTMCIHNFWYHSLFQNCIDASWLIPTSCVWQCKFCHPHKWRRWKCPLSLWVDYQANHGILTNIRQLLYFLIVRFNIQELKWIIFGQKFHSSSQIKVL